MNSTRLEIGDVPPANPVAVFHAYHSALKRNRETCPFVPNWATFDPVEVPRALPYLSLIECRGETIGDYRQVVMGERMKALSGGNKTGVRLWDAFAPETRDARFTALRKCMEDRAVMLSIADLPYEGRDFLRVYRGSFPFCDGTAKVTHIAIVIAQAKSETMARRAEAIAETVIRPSEESPDTSRPISTNAFRCA